MMMTKYDVIKIDNMHVSLVEFAHLVNIVTCGGEFRYRIPGRGVVRKIKYPGLIKRLADVADYVAEIGKQIAPGIAEWIESNDKTS